MMKWLVLLLIAVAPASALAQSGVDGQGGPVVDHVPVDAGGPSFVPLGVDGAIGGSDPGARTARAPAGAAVAVPGTPGADESEDPAAAGIAAAQAIEDASRFCAAVPSQFAIDCLAERLAAVARSMPDTGALAESRQVLTDTAAKLRAVARSNADPGKADKLAAPSMPRPQATARPLTPVAPAAQEAANEAATAILQEAETLLLRSSDTDVAAPAAPQIERIAAAVGSNKVLLRSA